MQRLRSDGDACTASSLGDAVHLDRREPPFWLASSRSSSMARRAAFDSVSSSAMRLLAEVSSDFSLLVRPGTSPLLIRSWRRQV